MKKQIYFIFILTIVLISAMFVISQVNFEKTAVAKISGDKIYGNLDAWNNANGYGECHHFFSSGYTNEFCGPCMKIIEFWSGGLEPPPIFYGYFCAYVDGDDPVCPSERSHCYGISPTFDSNGNCNPSSWTPTAGCDSNHCCQCFGNSDCTSTANPKCYSDNTCGECEDNSDCIRFMTTPVCNQGVCIQCESDSDCTNNSNGPHCVGGMGCHECRNNDDCPAGKTCNYGAGYVCS